MNSKICKYCEEDKELNCYRKHESSKKTYYENICKKCTYLKRKKKITNLKDSNRDKYDEIIKKRNIKDKEYYSKNKEKINKRNNIYYGVNRQQIRAQRKIFRENNPERVKAWREKFLSNASAKIAMNLRKRTRYFLHSGKEWSNLLGCDIDHFKSWLEFNFEQEPDNDMNINNYGTIWEIDHVYPLSKFDMSKEEDIKKAFNWKNILPALCSHNKSKNNKICQDDLNKLNDRLKKYKKYTSKQNSS